jgi:hypothetical protein
MDRLPTHPQDVILDQPPVVFFRGQYVCRSFNGGMAAISGFVASALATAFAVYNSRMGNGVLSDVVSGMFALLALIFGGLGLWEFWGLASNRRVDVEINEDGIVCGNRFRPWDRVNTFVGKRYNNGVCLGFTPRRTGVWGGGDLPTTPLLTDQEYVELAREMIRQLSNRFPHLLIITHPTAATSDS